jgi:hypothetical protein
MLALAREFTPHRADDCPDIIRNRNPGVSASEVFLGAGIALRVCRGERLDEYGLADRMIPRSTASYHAAAA